jgi:hypothetical protein
MRRREMLRVEIVREGVRHDRIDMVGRIVIVRRHGSRLGAGVGMRRNISRNWNLSRERSRGVRVVHVEGYWRRLPLMVCGVRVERRRELRWENLMTLVVDSRGMSGAREGVRRVVHVRCLVRVLWVRRRMVRMLHEGCMMTVYFRCGCAWERRYGHRARRPHLLL